ncbi:MAG: hypothetical protein ACI9OH_001789 [Oleispira sp.]|jgi:hypothetical protein
MSHCCGGCGGEAPSNKKVVTENQAEELASSEKDTKEKITNSDVEVGTWQPEKK